MTLLPAYAIDGGRVPAQMLRMVAWVSTSGATGVVKPGDLRVQATATPSGSVTIKPGGAIIATGYTNSSSQQSYAVANDASFTFDIDPTGSSGGRTDYIGIRIDDPEYSGQTPADPLAALYCSVVRVGSINNLTYPFVPLAKVVLPASTGTVTNAMITDLRVVANPRELTVVRPVPTVTGDPGLTLSNQGTGEWFPNGNGPQSIDIPEWATRAQIECEWLGVRYPAGANPWGQMWVGYGPSTGGSLRENNTQHFSFDAASVNNVQRVNWKVADDVYIPASYRGTTQMFVPTATYDPAYTVANGKADMTATSGMVMRVRFMEVADPLAN